MHNKKKISISLSQSSYEKIKTIGNTLFKQDYWDDVPVSRVIDNLIILVYDIIKFDLDHFLQFSLNATSPYLARVLTYHYHNTKSRSVIPKIDNTYKTNKDTPQ